MSGLKKKGSQGVSERNLHNLVVVPEDGIAMEVLGGVEPKHVPHLTATNSILVHVCLNQIRLPGPIPQELKIQLISRRPCPIFRAHLQHSHAQKSEQKLFDIGCIRYLIKSSRKMSKTYIVSCHYAGRVTSDQLQLHAKPPKSITLLCLKPTTYSNFLKNIYILL